MVLRESNPLHLEVLGAAPVAGVPLEVDVFDGASPATLLAVLDGATGIAFDDMLNDVGGGKFRISRYDPKATEEILGREHLIKIKVGGVYRYAFWAEHRELVAVDAGGEQGGEYWEISGRGAVAYLARAAMANYNLLPAPSSPIDGKWSWDAQPLGAIWHRCIQERTAEPASALEFITVNFDHFTDSQGNLWSDTVELDISVGDNLLDIWRQFTALGLDSRMRHDLRLEAYVELGRHFDVSTGTGEVVFRAGKHFTSTVRRAHHTNEVKTRLWVKGSGDAWSEIVNPALEADPYVRRREGALQFGVTSDPTTLQRAGEAELRARALQVQGGISVDVTHAGNGDFQPYVHYDVGDWVTIHEPGVYDLQTVRIVGMSLEQKEQTFTVRLDLNTLEFDELVQLARRLNRSSSSGTASAATGLSAPSGTSEESVHPGLARHDAMGLATDLALAAAIDGIEFNGLADVDMTGLVDDRIPVWDAAAGKWKPEPVPGGGAVACVVYRTAALNSSAAAGGAAVAWDTEERDDGGLWAAGQPTRLTIPSDGWYHVGGKVSVSTSQDSQMLYLRKNGATIISQGRTYETTNGQILYVADSRPYYFVAGDYVELLFENGAAQALSVGSPANMNFWAYRI